MDMSIGPRELRGSSDCFLGSRKRGCHGEPHSRANVRFPPIADTSRVSAFDPSRALDREGVGEPNQSWKYDR
jgi:hypothetical protein